MKLRRPLLWLLGVPFILMAGLSYTCDRVVSRAAKDFAEVHQASCQQPVQARETVTRVSWRGFAFAFPYPAAVDTDKPEVLEVTQYRSNCSTRPARTRFLLRPLSPADSLDYAFFQKRLCSSASSDCRAQNASGYPLECVHPDSRPASLAWRPTTLCLVPKAHLTLMWTADSVHENMPHTAILDGLASAPLVAARP
jgi:hypothetical protein